MIEFGKTLQKARKDKGYTIPQIAEMTRLKTSVVEGLEKEDFSGIAAPIYGRGFVKLYCEAVGIDPKPLVDEFMAILAGVREPAIKERPMTAEPAPAPQPEAKAEPAPSVPEPDLFSQPEPVAPAVSAPAPSFARFAASVREDEPLTGPSFVNPRILVLAGCAFALLIVLVLGIRALYRATTSDETVPAKTAETAETAKPSAKSAPAAKPAARVRQQAIPSLYID